MNKYYTMDRDLTIASYPLTNRKNIMWIKNYGRLQSIPTPGTKIWDEYNKKAYGEIDYNLALPFIEIWKYGFEPSPIEVGEWLAYHYWRLSLKSAKSAAEHIKEINPEIDRFGIYDKILYHYIQSKKLEILKYLEGNQ